MTPKTLTNHKCYCKILVCSWLMKGKCKCIVAPLWVHAKSQRACGSWASSTGQAWRGQGVTWGTCLAVMAAASMRCRPRQWIPTPQMGALPLKWRSLLPSEAQTHMPVWAPDNCQLEPLKHVLLFFFLMRRAEEMCAHRRRFQGGCTCSRQSHSHPGQTAPAWPQGGPCAAGCVAAAVTVTSAPLPLGAG